MLNLAQRWDICACSLLEQLPFLPVGNCMETYSRTLQKAENCLYSDQSLSKCFIRYTIRHTTRCYPVYLVYSPGVSCGFWFVDADILIFDLFVQRSYGQIGIELGCWFLWYSIHRTVPTWTLGRGNRVQQFFRSVSIVTYCANDFVLADAFLQWFSFRGYRYDTCKNADGANGNQGTLLAMKWTAIYLKGAVTRLSPLVSLKKLIPTINFSTAKLLGSSFAFTYRFMDST